MLTVLQAIIYFTITKNTLVKREIYNFIHLIVTQPVEWIKHIRCANSMQQHTIGNYYA